MQSSGTGESDDVQELLASAREHADRGNLHAALCSCGKALKLAPKEMSAWSCAAGILSNMSRWFAAAEACRRALEIDPNGVDIQAVLSTLGTARRLSPAAYDLYDRALGLRASPERGFARSAIALLKCGDPTSAIRAAEEAVAAAPKDAYALGVLAIAQRYAGMENASEETLVRIGSLLEADPHPYCRLARLFYGFDQYWMAVHYLGLLAERSTPTADDLYFVAVLLHNMTRRKEAIAPLRRAVQLDPTHAKSRYLLGLDSLYIQDSEEARRQHRMLVKLDSQLAEQLLAYLAPWRKRELFQIGWAVLFMWGIPGSALVLSPLAPFWYAGWVVFSAWFVVTLINISRSGKRRSPMTKERAVASSQPPIT